MGGGDTCCASTRGTERGDDIVMVQYVYEILERFLSSCSVTESINKELNQLKQRNERNK